MEVKLPQFVNVFNNCEKVRLNIVYKDSIISPTEECLQNWFKCTKNDCFETFNDKNEFIGHSINRHKSEHLFCIYCNRISDQEKKMYSAENLVNHMSEKHRFRKFQCNQCLFRAISVDHINIHQSLIHVNLHNASLHKSQIDGKNCKIIECPPIQSQQSSVLPKNTYFYERYHSIRKNMDINGDHNNDYQCLYCDFMNESQPIVIEHCVERHADYPIMFYNPEPQITSTQSPNINTNHLSEIDLFSGKHETQENSISSTGICEPFDTESDDSRSDSHNARKRTNDDNHYENTSNFNKKQKISITQKEKLFVCLLCAGNVSKMKENAIDSHIAMFHNKCKVKHPNQPFCCAYCKNFFGNKAEVNCHSISCSKKTNEKLRTAFVFIVAENEQKIKSKPINENYERKQLLLTENQISKSEIELSERRKTNKINVEKNSEIQTESHKRNKESNVCQTEEKSGNKSKIGLKTTIEMVLSESDEESDEDSDIEPKSQYVCFFCDITSSDINIAKSHLETHFPNFNKRIEDYKKTKPVHKWLKIFVEKQESLFERRIESNDYNCYKCPICVRIGNLKNIKVKRFKHFWELRAHYWEHSCWQPVVCNVCKPEYHLPNCDHIIVRHLNAKHNDKLLKDNNPLVSILTGDKMRNCCSPQQRSALEQSLITYNRYEVLDSYIENTLKEILENNELKLRRIHNCPLLLPEVQLIRLPQIDFDNEYMVRKYLKSIKRKYNCEHLSNACNSNKVYEEIELGSSSDENNDRMSPIVRIKKLDPKILFSDDSCEELLNTNECKNPSIDDHLSDCVLITDEEEHKFENNRRDSIEQVIQQNVASTKSVDIYNKTDEALHEMSEENKTNNNNSETSKTTIENRRDSLSIQTNDPCSSNSTAILASNEKKYVCHYCNELFTKNEREVHFQQHPGLNKRFTRFIDNNL